MFKKILAASALILGCPSITFAYSFYLGPGVAYEDIRGGGADYNGIGPRIIAGYGGIFRDSMYLAGEVFGEPRSITLQNTQSSTGVNLKARYSYGASLVPGYDIDGTLMAYGRLGISYVRFDKMNATRNGCQLGLGLEYRLNEVWSARGEYDYIAYSSVADVSPRDNQILVSVLYHFVF